MLARLLNNHSTRVREQLIRSTCCELINKYWLSTTHWKLWPVHITDPWGQKLYPLWQGRLVMGQLKSSPLLERQMMVGQEHRHLHEKSNTFCYLQHRLQRRGEDKAPCIFLTLMILQKDRCLRLYNLLGNAENRTQWVSGPPPHLDLLRSQVNQTTACRPLPARCLFLHTASKKRMVFTEEHLQLSWWWRTLNTELQLGEMLSQRRRIPFFS